MPSSVMRRPSVLLIMGFAVVMLSGCGDANQTPTFPVSGQLRVDGEPAQGAQVTFHPANGQNFDPQGSRASGVVDADGHFRLTTYEPGDGAPAGEYVVTVYWATDPAALEPSPDRLQGRFADPQQSELRVEVTAGENQLEPFQLKSGR